MSECSLTYRAAMPPPPPSTRARPLPPEERRRAIIDATLPLLMEHGASVSTRQIAHAAGIAEGTIFRAFPDKESIIVAVVESAIESDVTAVGLRSVDPALPLDDRLVAAVEIIQRRVQHVFALLAVLDSMSGPGRGRVRSRRPVDLTALTDLIAPDTPRLLRPPGEVARLVHGLTFSSTHPLLCADDPLSPDEIVALVLDGVRRRGTDTDDTEAPQC